MKTQKVVIAVFIVLYLGFQDIAVSSPTEAGNNKFSFGLHGASFISYTDIKQSSFFNSASDALTFGGGLNLNYHVSPVFSFQWRFLYAELEGLDKNLKFESMMLQGSMNARVSLNTLFAPLNSSNQWMNVYGLVGAGILMHRSNLFNYETGELERYAYEGKEGVGKDDFHSAFFVPFGLGVNFKISDRVDIGLESTFNFVMSDELDAYPVSNSRKDMFNYTGIGLTFRLGKNTKSMDWAQPRQAMHPGDSRPVDALNGRVSALEAELRLINEKDESELVDMKNDIKELFEGHEDLKLQNVQLYGALEDIAQQLIVLEARDQQVVEAPKVPERPTVDQFYSVQIMAQRVDVPIHEVRSYLRIGFDIEKIFVDGWYKYCSGRFNDLEDAKLHMQRLWEQGVRDAFIVKYSNGKLTPR